MSQFVRYRVSDIQNTTDIYECKQKFLLNTALSLGSGLGLLVLVQLELIP